MQQASRQIETTRRPLAPGRLDKVRDHIEAKLEGEIRIAQLAAIAGISEKLFRRSFSEATGVAPLRYIMQRRLERARRLLLETDYPIAEIALTAGYCDQSRMTTHFRHALGVTPARLRRQG